MVINQCRVVCESDLKSDLMTSITEVDLTNIVDRTCNGVMFLTDLAGLVDIEDPTSGPWLESESPRSRIVTSMVEIKQHFSPSSEVYKAAELFFLNSQNRGVANYFFIGFWDISGGEAAATALDLISACNPCWTHLTVSHFDSNNNTLIDDLRMLEIAEWSITNDKIPYFLSTDAKNEDPTDGSSFKGELRSLGLDDCWVSYTRGECKISTDPQTGEALYYANGQPVLDELGQPVLDEFGQPVISDGSEPILETEYKYQEFLVAGWVANVDLSQTESGYSMAYKPQGGQGWIGIKIDDFDDGVVSSITGSLPDGTINTNNNGHANVYTRTAGYEVMFNGMTVGGSWLDQLHLSLFLKKRIQDAIAALMVKRRRIPYDDSRGQAILANSVSDVMTTAQNNGHFTNDPQEWELAGPYIRKGIGWVIRQDSLQSQTAARKNQRLSPAMKVCYIPAGGVNHLPITLCTLSVPTAV